MEDELLAIQKEATEAVSSVDTLPALEQLKAGFLGPRGKLTLAMKGMGKVPKEDKPRIGKALNLTKNALEEAFRERQDSLFKEARLISLGPAPDVTLPSPDPEPGREHPIIKTRDAIVDILRKAGFAVVDGPEIESEYYCFDALNTPPDHPARDLQDTFYLPDALETGNISRKGSERFLLRTHTSPVQVRVMEKNAPPIRIISPGRCFRRDTTDATHSASFTQIEGLYVDEGVTVRDLKAILDHLFRSLLGKDAKTRFRPHFFPYTEPSFELDASSAHLKKVGKEWTEMGGCGMVDPTVFEAVGYDPAKVSGYAFGFGIERIAMILYGIDDIRHFYQNDQRFLRQFS